MAKCIGCGIKLQSQNENELGYAPFIDEENGTYCKRCYQIIHNGKKYKPVLSSNDYYYKIGIIKDKKALVLLMIDIMDLFGGFIPHLSEYIGNNEVVILVNKVDLLPKTVHLKRIEEAIREKGKKEKLNIVSVIMISAKTKSNVENVMNKIMKLREEKDYKKPYAHKNGKPNFKETYILGCASVGKSTFINAIKELYLNDKAKLTTSDQYQTTQEFIKISLGVDNFLIDTPGLINYGHYGAYLDFDSVKKLTPKTYLKPKTYQLDKGQTIYMGGLARIDFIEGEKINASFYTSNDLNIHRTKIINADKIYNEHLGEILVPPCSKEEIELIKEWDTKTIENLTGAFDLIISGVGFVHLVGTNMKISVSKFKKVDAFLVETFI